MLRTRRLSTQAELDSRDRASATDMAQTRLSKNVSGLALVLAARLVV